MENTRTAKTESTSAHLSMLLRNLNGDLKSLSRSKFIDSIRSESFYILHYRDSNGNITKRLIKVYELSAYYNHHDSITRHTTQYSAKPVYQSNQSNHANLSRAKRIYIKAHCYRAGESRTFRLDRVISLYEADFIINMDYSPVEIQRHIELLENTDKAQPTPTRYTPPKTQEINEEKTYITNPPQKIKSIQKSNSVQKTESLQKTNPIRKIPPSHKIQPSRRRLKIGSVLLIVVTFFMRTYYFFVIGIVLIAALITGKTDTSPLQKSIDKSKNLPQITFVKLLPMPESINIPYNRLLKQINNFNSVINARLGKNALIPVSIASSKNPSLKPVFIKQFIYRDTVIEVWKNKYGRKYFAPLLDLEDVSFNRLKRKINGKLFQQRTGIYNKQLIQMYVRADSNRDGKLSRQEIKAFQRMLSKRFRYISNKTALRPDEFIKQGGGDCEDWALMTAGLLTYWGYSAYVGGLENTNYPLGHAVCLLYSAKKPPIGMVYIKITNNDRLRMYDPSIKPGYYIPIDYAVVGGYSKAITTRKKGTWYYGAIYVPEKIYGRVM